MTEDDKLVYDIESYWEMNLNLTQFRQQAFEHKEYKSLYRIIDFNDQTIRFNDIARIQKVIDIHSKLDENVIKEFMPKFISIINAERPITMPYKPEKLTLFVCMFDDILGVLYYKVDTEEEKNVYPIKRYYKIDRDPLLTFIEMTGEEYLKKYNKRFIQTQKEKTNANNDSER